MSPCGACRPVRVKVGSLGGVEAASWVVVGSPGHCGAEQSSRTYSHPPSFGIHWEELPRLLGVAVTVLGTLDT